MGPTRFEVGFDVKEEELFLLQDEEAILVASKEWIEAQVNGLVHSVQMGPYRIRLTVEMAEAA